MGFTMVAMSVAFGDQQTWDVARSQANSLLEERATDEQVTTAVHRLANSTIDLVTAMEAIASDPNANTGLLGTDTQALDAMGEPLAQVQKAVDEIGSVCK